MKTLKKIERKKILLELDIELLEKIEALKAEIGVSRREIIEHAITYFLLKKGD